MHVYMTSLFSCKFGNEANPLAQGEMVRIHGGLLSLLLVFHRESVLRFRLPDRRRQAGKALLTATACVLLPPLRMGCRSQVRPKMMQASESGVTIDRGGIP